MERFELALAPDGAQSFHAQDGTLSQRMALRRLTFSPQRLDSATGTDLCRRCFLPPHFHLIQVLVLVVKLTPVKERPYFAVFAGPARHHLQSVCQPGCRKTPDAFLPQDTAPVLLAPLLTLPEQRGRFHPGGLHSFQRHAMAIIHDLDRTLADLQRSL